MVKDMKNTRGVCATGVCKNYSYDSPIDRGKLSLQYIDKCIKFNDVKYIFREINYAL